MSAYKKLNANDVKITPFEAHKSYEVSNANSASLGVTIHQTSWTNTTKDAYTDANRRYFQLDHLYYKDYFTTLGNRLDIEDSPYLFQERRLYEDANVISIPQNTFGSEIQPNTFEINGIFGADNTEYNLKDDGYGNLYDTNMGNDYIDEKDRVVYVGPVKGFKKYDLTVDNETGKSLVNPPIGGFHANNIYDDSVYLNTCKFVSMSFTEDNTTEPIGFPSLDFSSYRSQPSYVEVANTTQTQFDDNFSVSFRLNFESSNITELDLGALTNHTELFIASKNGYIPRVNSPQQGAAGLALNLSSSGNAQIVYDTPSAQYPFEIWFQAEGSDYSFNFKQSDGINETTVSWTLTSTELIGDHLYTFVSTDTQQLIYYDNIAKAAETKTHTSQFNNESPIYIGSRGDVDTYRGGYMIGKLYQFMVIDEELSSDQITQLNNTITGTKAIGNVFYDSGISTITHPNYKDVLTTDTPVGDPNYTDLTFRNSVDVTNYTSPLDTLATEGIRYKPDGTSYYIAAGVDANGYQGIIQVDLSTPYDISTATTITSSSFQASSSFGGSIEGNITGITFKHDGTKFYVIGETHDDLFELDLSVAWDITTAVYNGVRAPLQSSFTFHAEDCLFSNDSGSYFYAINDTDDDTDKTIGQWSMGGTYNLGDISMGTIDHELTIIGFDLHLYGMDFSVDGTKMFLIGQDASSGNVIKYYTLTTPYDISTATYISDITPTLTTGLGAISGISVGENEEDLIISRKNSFISQYTIGTVQPWDIKYKNTHLIYEHEVSCTVEEHEFNATSNITARKGNKHSNSELKDFATGSEFHPYVSTIGLYNDEGDLLVVGKLGQPTKTSEETDTTFIIRYDT
jgi:hypothetical protein